MMPPRPLKAKANHTICAPRSRFHKISTWRGDHCLCRRCL